MLRLPGPLGCHAIPGMENHGLGSELVALGDKSPRTGKQMVAAGSIAVMADLRAEQRAGCLLGNMSQLLPSESG